MKIIIKKSILLKNITFIYSYYQCQIHKVKKHLGIILFVWYNLICKDILKGEKNNEVRMEKS